MKKRQDNRAFRPATSPLGPLPGTSDAPTDLIVAGVPEVIGRRFSASAAGTLVEIQGGHSLGLRRLAPLFRRALELTDNALTLEALSVDAALATSADIAALLSPFPPSPDLLTGLGAAVVTANLLFIKGKDRFPDVARAAWLSLLPGGLLLAAGHKTHSILPFSRVMAEVFGNVIKVAGRKGCSLFVSAKEGREAPGGTAIRQAQEGDSPVVVAGPTAGSAFSFDLASSPWVFAAGQMDAGTRFLLEHSPSLALPAKPADPTPPRAICDLGCGSGVLGMAAARRYPGSRVYLLDSSASAVALAARNLAANRITNAVAGVTAGLAFFRDQSVDLILCNPPFHQEHLADHTTAQAFIADAKRVLCPGGTLEIVANRFLSYEGPLRSVFGPDAGPVAQDGSFKLLVARQTTPRP